MAASNKDQPTEAHADKVNSHASSGDLHTTDWYIAELDRWTHHNGASEKRLMDDALREAIKELQSSIAGLPARRRKIAALSHLPLERPPGHRLAFVLSSLLTANAFARYVAPVIADMQYEHANAVAAEKKLRAQWIMIRCYLLVIPGWLYAFFSAKLATLFRHGANR